MKIRTYKVKNQDLEVVDVFEESCWYNAQVVFTDKMRKTDGYIEVVDRKDAEYFGFDWIGAGYYGPGDTIINNSLVSTFYNGTESFTINAK